MNVVLTIAGSDSGGGAGIQADLKTFEAFGLFGTSAITAVTAQNTLGVRGVWEIPVEGVIAQIDAVLDDFPVRAIKIGMLASLPIVQGVAARLARLEQTIPVVLDPVMVATSGDRLLQPEAIESLRSDLLPIATIITPNLAEGRLLAGCDGGPEEVVSRLLDNRTAAVLLTGGDEPERGGGGELMTVDYLGMRDESGAVGIRRLSAPAIETSSTHGTGCTLSSAIAASIATGDSLRNAVVRGREYVRRGLERAPGLGKGHGPLRHSAV